MDLISLRQIEALASLPRYQLARASRRLVWRCYAAGELILPHQVHIDIEGLVYRGKVQVATVQQGRRQVVEHILAGEPINGEIRARHTSPAELRSAELTILCLVPLDGLQPATLFERAPQLTQPSISITPSTDRTAFRILLFSIVVLLALLAWYWQSPWRTLISKFTYGLASRHLESGEYTKALSLLQTSTDFNPRLASAYNDIGFIFYQQGQSREARAAFQQALAADPTFAVAQNNLGLTYLEDGQADLASEALKKAVTLDPESVAAWTNLGVVEHLLGPPKEAIRAYRASLRLNPNNIVAQVNLGVLYYEREQLPEARDYLEMALYAYPYLPRARAILGVIALSEGDHARARRELQAVASDLADDPILHFYLALWYEEAGMWESAERELARVLELQPHPDLAALARSHLVVLTPSDQVLFAEEIEEKGE